MNAQGQEKCTENVGSASNDIESAFTTMVQRWLVKGSNGEWQLAKSKKQTGTAKLTQRREIAKKQSEQFAQFTTQVKHVSFRVNQLSPHHIHKKFTKEFLERSKMRFAGLRPNTLETTRSDTNVPQQRPRAALRNDERFLSKCNKGSGNEMKDEYVRVEYESSTQVQSAKQTQEHILVLNDKDFNTSSKRAAASPPIPRTERISKMPRFQVNNSRTQLSPGSGDSSKVKKESNMDLRNLANQTPNMEGTKTFKITLERTADGIPVLCNGQRKCKSEDCYKAENQHGYCLAHGRSATEVDKNALPSQDFSQNMTGGGNVAGNLKQTPNLSHVNHDNSSTSDTDMTSSRSTSPSTSTSKSRPKLQTAKKMAKPAASDAWRLSDLPNLFRNASCKRTRKSAVGVKEENVGYASPADLEEKCRRTKSPRPTGRSIRGGKVNAPVCKVKNCEQKVASEGFCRTHYECKRCKIDGCRNLATSGVRGLCCSHGGRSKCLVEGCVKNAHYRGLCSTHGGRKPCQVEGCVNKASYRGLCSSHGGRRTCQAEGCAKAVCHRGLCSGHGGKRLCNREGCNKSCQKRGLCAKHFRESQGQAGESLLSGGRDRLRVKKEEFEDY
ncbi:WRKY transcription factor 19 [Phytophthora nicotianae]|uniref:WRKY transcription factor 19 n=1 Tax=Phytophthora nicotianae TaxID=4792 RepID=A0A0W8CCE7_PHYNI|nr:WRKY transcription factor 19 [Phytophthora nicotianae]